MHPQDHSTTGHLWRFLWQRVFAPISIIATCLYVVFFVVEFIHAAHEKFKTQPPPAFTLTMRNAVQRQITEVGSVNTHLLADTLITDLSTFDCHWYFACHPRPAQTVPTYSFFKPCPNCDIQFGTTSQEVVPPELTFRVGGAPVPTWHTVFGSPHALRVAAVKVAAAGPWAIIMFLSCTIIYFSVALLWGAKSESFPPLIVIIVITLSPLGITVLANLFQWAATKAFNGINWFLGGLIFFIGYSSAISLAVAVPHIWKAPREIIEATELIRRA